MFSKTVSETYMSLCRSLNTPRSLACKLLYENKEHIQLLELETNPLHYLEDQLATFRDDYLITEYLSKYTGLKTGIDTKAVAYSSFTAAELTCEESNRRISDYLNRTDVSPRLLRVITRAQVLIEGCIRTSPSFSKMSESSRWGKGSTFSLKGEGVRIDAKVCEGQISVTRQALQFVRAAMAEDYALLNARGIPAEGPTSMLNCEFCIVHGSRGLTVLKNAKTDRFIAAEPSGNVFIQLGYGALLRSCLQRCGIDLDNQQVNQGLAKLAIDLGLATVDLKAASDTICRELVWLLLPFRWAYALDSARSHMMLVNQKWITLEKFSSMGNGFTFELETLIFWALTQASCDVEKLNGRVSVYGDDIICPVAVIPALHEVMDFCGFAVNSKKSHVSGSFRESCGKHYFKGCDVSPIYQKECLVTVEAYYRFYNRLAYHASDRGTACGTTLFCDEKLREVVRIAGSFREKLKVPHYIPLQRDEESRTLDGGLAIDSRSIKLRFSGDKYHVKAWVFTPTAVKGYESAVYAVHLRTTRHICKTITGYLRMKHREDHVVNARQYVCYLKETGSYKAIGPELALPFTGEVTLRGRGKWSTKRRSFSHICDVRWV